jgi:HdeA/HdeB family
MKLRLVFLVAASLLVCKAVPAAAADDIDFSTIKCGDFISGSKDDAILLLTWIEGYFTKKNAPPIMYGDKAREHARDIRDYCLNHGDDTLFNAAKTVIK